MGLPVVDTTGQAISAFMHPEILDDLTQKPTKQIRTDIVKMTSEASLLPTDLKNIHQAVYRSRRKCFLTCLRADMSCMNAFEIKACKGELFLLANDTENEMVILTLGARVLTTLYIHFSDAQG